MVLAGGILNGNRINFEKVESLRNVTPKRICFNTYHSNALRKIKQNDTIGFFNVPFDESIGRIFRKETGCNLKQNKYGKYFYPIKEDDEMNAIERFIEKYKINVFLRDNLDISIALAENFANEEERTYIGLLEKKAKYDDCQDSYEELKEIMKNFIKDSPYYNKAKYICAVPSSEPEEISLPVSLCDEIATELELVSLTSSVYWNKRKESLKECPLRDKWKSLEAADISVNDDFQRKNVILLDDLYQSGTTMQYVAMKLKERKARLVLGLTIVKSRKDSDNF